MDDYIVYLKRTLQNKDGMFGEMWLHGKKICVTGELPWKDNAPGLSCIPAGAYPVVPHDSPEHPGTWEITNIDDRSEILIHNGNWPLHDSKGCILVGDEVGILGGSTAVFNSLSTLDVLRDLLPPEFSIVITNNF